MQIHRYRAQALVLSCEDAAQTETEEALLALSILASRYREGSLIMEKEIASLIRGGRLINVHGLNIE